jgi:hypothetical protein
METSQNGMVFIMPLMIIIGTDDHDAYDDYFGCCCQL